MPRVRIRIKPCFWGRGTLLGVPHLCSNKILQNQCAARTPQCTSCHAGKCCSLSFSPLQVEEALKLKCCHTNVTWTGGRKSQARVSFSVSHENCVTKWAPPHHHTGWQNFDNFLLSTQPNMGKMKELWKGARMKCSAAHPILKATAGNEFLLGSLKMLPKPPLIPSAQISLPSPGAGQSTEQSCHGNGISRDGSPEGTLLLGSHWHCRTGS